MTRLYVAVRVGERERERGEGERKKRRIKKDGCIEAIRGERRGWRDGGEKEVGRETKVFSGGGRRSVIEKDGEGGRKKEGKRWRSGERSGGRSETGSGWSCAPTPVLVCRVDRRVFIHKTWRGVRLGQRAPGLVGTLERHSTVFPLSFSLRAFVRSRLSSVDRPFFVSIRAVSSFFFFFFLLFSSRF